ncbi:MAG: MOP flippase family protein [Pirellulales bacterium]|nr:MOP flippase family protein [Pirellulales bacterium]
MSSPDQEMNVYSAVRWSAVAKYGAQVVEMATSLYVARIVAPECYGLLGMAIVITGFLQIFQNLGFGAALIQRKEINDRLTSSLFYVSLAFSSLLALGLVALAPLFSWFYGDNRVGPIIAILSVTIVLFSLGLVPSSLLTRRMAFQKLAWVDIFVSVVRAVSVIALALAGWGVWALVWSSIAGSVTNTFLLYLFCDWRPRWFFYWSEIRSVFGFGANLTGFSIMNYVSQNADNLIIGAFLGATPLGYYSLGYRILLLPREAVTGVLNRVLFPAFCRIRDDDNRLSEAYLRVCGAIAFITFPMMTGIAIVAEPFVDIILGPRWLPAVPVICILAPLGMLQSISSTTGQIYLAKGKVHWMLRLVMFGSIVHTTGFAVGVVWGITGVAYAYVVTASLMLLVDYHFIFTLVHGLNHRSMLRTLMPYCVSAGGMGGLVVITRTILEYASCANRILLPICVVSGIVAYGLIIWWIKPPALRELARIIPRRLLANTPISRVNEA